MFSKRVLTFFACAMCTQVSLAQTSGDSLLPDTAADAKDAPSPQNAHGIASGKEEPSGLLWVPRIVFAPLRLAVEIVSMPVRASLYSIDKYPQIRTVTDLILSNDIAPIIVVDSGFGGISAGLRVGFSDFAGKGISASASAAFGGEYRQTYSARFDTGRWLGPVTLQLRSRFSIRGRDNFYGFGHNMPVEDPVGADPRLVSSDAKYRQDVWTNYADLEWSLTRAASLGFTVGHRHRKFYSTGDFELEDSITTQYQVSKLPSFEEGANHLYFELRATHDNRRPLSKFENPGIKSSGTRAQAHLGYARSLGDNDYAFMRYGIHTAASWRFAEGPRVLSIRGIAEGLAPAAGTVPFTAYPELGGSRTMRAFDFSRFREKITTTVAVEYEWALNRSITATLFAEGGRVVDHWSEIGKRRPEFSLGGELKLYTEKGLLGRVSIAASPDGPFTIRVAFDSAFSQTERMEEQ